MPLEMESTVRYFGTQAGRWNTWSEGGPTPGHSAYALRQASMWQSLGKHASEAFAKAQAVYVLNPEEDTL